MSTPTPRAAPAPQPDASSASARKPRRGDLLEAELDAIDARGNALGRSGAYAVRVRRGTPGSRVRVEVLRRRRERVDARVVELLAPSPLAATPRCEHFGTCGGCSFQDLAYAAQLELARALAERQLAAAGLLGGPTPVQLDPPLGCDSPWRYRNKMDFTFGSRRWIEPGEPAGAPSGFALGLHPRDFYGKVLDVRACSIQFEEGDRILESARRLAIERGLEPWDLERHAGLLRHLVLRKSFTTGEILVNLVTSEEAPERVLPYARALLAERPEITTLVQSIRTQLAVVAVGEREVVLHGSGRIRERLLGLKLELSAESFFQTNTLQAARLFTIVREQADAWRSDVVLDLYCGAGALSLALARDAGQVVGLELVASAVADARRNAERNGIANARFEACDVAERLAATDGTLPRPDVCVVDPPRAGVPPRALARLAELAPRRIVYVSCNLDAGARDAAALARSGYRLVRVQPIDQFPHTPHLESVLTLERAP